MDLFRSRKRNTDKAGMEHGGQLQKHQRDHMGGSLHDLLGMQDGDATPSDESVSDSGEDENLNKASRQQKTFAKKSIKREKKKEKDLREKLDKNTISLDDFLGKQSEFKMWLYEEKSKNAGGMSSPKLKTHFKQFVRLWNKRKLAPKYYRGSTLPESPAPLTPTKFLSDNHGNNASPLKTVIDEEGADKAAPTSPFVTFGKTPPKVFRTKKFQLFGNGPAKDVALISVAPLGSPQVKVKHRSHSRDEYDGHGVDTVTGAEYKPVIYARPADILPRVSTSDEKEGSCTGEDLAQDELWPPPPPPCNFDKGSYSVPSDFAWGGNSCETKGSNSVSASDSPHVPPPPPPRLESLHNTVSPKLHQNYADPYDTLPPPPSSLISKKLDSDYQDPVDCISSHKSDHNTETGNQLVSACLPAEHEEPDTSLYTKPVAKKTLSTAEIECLYTVPMKKMKRDAWACKGGPDGVKTDGVRQDRVKPDRPGVKRPDPESELYVEIMEHIKRGKSEEKELPPPSGKMLKPDPDYETIDECLLALNSDNAVKPVDNTGSQSKPQHFVKNVTKFASLSRSKKGTVMAASTEKIYETYLSHRKNVDILRHKQGVKTVELGPAVNPLKHRCKSQPDVNSDNRLKSFNFDDKYGPSYDQTRVQTFTSFKPVDVSDSKFFNQNSDIPKSTDRAKSVEYGLNEIPAPGTPVILATPSFDSLCDVSSLSNKSGSFNSLPVKHSPHSGSSESLNSKSNMSVSTSSSLSFGPDDKTGSLQSLHSDKSLSPVKEEQQNCESVQAVDEPKLVVENVTDCKPCDDDAYRNIPMTPGKINSIKHGIDLSVYLLKPSQPKTDDTSSSKSGTSENCEQGSVPKPEDTARTLNDRPSRLTFKDTLSGVKTKLDSCNTGNKKEMERRHTVQTVKEFKLQENVRKTPVPNVGIASKNRKKYDASLLNTKFPSLVNEGEQSTGLKRQCEELRAGEHYLETDLDSVLNEPPRRPLKKSKSHSGFESGASTVITDIW